MRLKLWSLFLLDTLYIQVVNIVPYSSTERSLKNFQYQKSFHLVKTIRWSIQFLSDDFLTKQSWKLVKTQTFWHNRLNHFFRMGSCSHFLIWWILRKLRRSFGVFLMENCRCLTVLEIVPFMFYTPWKSVQGGGVKFQKWSRCATMIFW